MVTDPTLMIGAATALVTALAHAVVQVSKVLREWRKDDRRPARSSGRSSGFGVEGRTIEQPSWVVHGVRILRFLRFTIPAPYRQ